MCWGYQKVTGNQVCSVYDCNGELATDSPEIYDIPQHADYPLLNTDVLTGILGFCYETKDTVIVIYSTVETKTFCYIMQLKPISS